MSREDFKQDILRNNLISLKRYGKYIVLFDKVAEYHLTSQEPDLFSAMSKAVSCLPYVSGIEKFRVKRSYSDL